MKLDPITLEIQWKRLVSMVDEASAAFVRTSFSVLVREANEAARKNGLANRAQFFQRNVFDADLSKVDVIFMWLFPELQRLLRPKILAEARPGTRVVTTVATEFAASWKPLM